MNIEQAILAVMKQLLSVSDSSRIDAELLVGLVCHKSRAALFADLHFELSVLQVAHLNELTQKRCALMPMAYILGEQEFWSLTLKVTPDTLIPRPATECLVEWILNSMSTDEECAAADLGTGSGAIAIALAHERPQWHLDATDVSEQALVIAQENALAHQVKNINFFQGSWCEALPTRQYDLIVSNPPYIDQADKHLIQLQHEPQGALVAVDNGLAAIKIIAEQARDYLTADGVMVIEHGYEQSLTVKEIMQAFHYQQVAIHNDLSGQPRFVTARM